MTATAFEGALAAFPPDRVQQGIRVKGGAALGPSGMTKGPPGVKVMGPDAQGRFTVRIAEQSATNPNAFAEQVYFVPAANAQAVLDWLANR
jgi:hypothetical protein